MFSLHIIIRGITVILIVFRILYWISIEKKADKVKPKTAPFTFSGKLKDYVLYFFWLILAMQLLGVDIFPFAHNIVIQVVGFILCLAGVCISILGRHALGVNWTHVGEAQIKKRHEFIKTGIYQYIRHPIYSGVFFAVVGGEIVAESYLAIFCFVLFLYGAYTEGRKEEVLLVKHFGKEYERYMKKSNMLIPYVI